MFDRFVLWHIVLLAPTLNDISKDPCSAQKALLEDVVIGWLTAHEHRIPAIRESKELQYIIYIFSHVYI